MGDDTISGRDIAEERARIEHELDILRTRYALMERSGRMLKVFFAIVLPITAVLIALIIVHALVTDLVFGVFVVGVGAVLAVLVWVALRKMPFRWIDVASPFGMLTDAIGGIGPTPRSEAQMIEQMIAIREKRLAEIKGREQ